MRVQGDESSAAKLLARELHPASPHPSAAASLLRIRASASISKMCPKVIVSSLYAILTHKRFQRNLLLDSGGGGGGTTVSY